MYATKAIPNEELEKGYELYKEAVNGSGYMTKETIYVDYYYVLKTATITDSIVKGGTTEKITSEDESVNYKITYTAEIENYTGNATVTITDTLPYKLDTTKMNVETDLNGGKYNESDQTITWTDTITGIDTFKEPTGKKKITVEKNINVVFKNISTK